MISMVTNLCNPDTGKYANEYFGDDFMKEDTMQ